jgi:hypothetical protein
MMGGETNRIKFGAPNVAAFHNAVLLKKSELHQAVCVSCGSELTQIGRKVLNLLPTLERGV